MKKIILIGIICMFLISCQNVQQQERETEITGTKGITLSFLEETPPNKILVGTGGEHFDVTVIAKNDGSYSAMIGTDPNKKDTVNGHVFLSGFDKNIIAFSDYGNVTGISPAPTVTSISDELVDNDLSSRSYQNKVGGFDYIDFKGYIKYANLPVQPYKPKLTATSCYNYNTVASTPVCIDFEPNKRTVEKVCKTSPINLKSQGAPIAVTSVEEEVLGSEIRFKIKIKNIGGGDVFSAWDAGNSKHATENCNPTSISIERKNFDLVTLQSVFINDKSGTLQDLSDGAEERKCVSLKKLIGKDGTEIADSKAIKLLDGEGFIICTAPKTLFAAQPQGFTTPLEIKLSYGYRTTIQKDIEIVKTEG